MVNCFKIFETYIGSDCLNNHCQLGGRRGVVVFTFSLRRPQVKSDPPYHSHINLSALGTYDYIQCNPP